MVNRDSLTFCNDLAKQSKLMAIFLQNHVEYYGELLIHLFMADLLRYLKNINESEKISVVDFLDKSMSASEDAVDNAICLSFVGNIETVCELNDLLSGQSLPRIRDEWHRYH